jgi:hypothetical protein
MEFLGLVNMASHSIPLAILAPHTIHLYAPLDGPAGSQRPFPGGEFSLSGDLAKSFDLQARYILPLMIGAIAFSIVAAAPLYWTTSNIFMIIQEYLSGKRFSNTKDKKVNLEFPAASAIVPRWILLSNQFLKKCSASWVFPNAESPAKK